MFDTPMYAPNSADLDASHVRLFPRVIERTLKAQEQHGVLNHLALLLYSIDVRLQYQEEQRFFYSQEGFFRPSPSMEKAHVYGGGSEIDGACVSPRAEDYWPCETPSPSPLPSCKDLPAYLIYETLSPTLYYRVQCTVSPSSTLSKRTILSSHL